MSDNSEKDISKEEDIIQLVNTFYDKVNQDELLGPVFNEEANIDWDEHLPKMYEFWKTLLFGTMSYKGQPFPKHQSLPIGREHFNRWIDLFEETVDTCFEGPKAEEAKSRARNIAMVFQSKMGLMERSRDKNSKKIL